MRQVIVAWARFARQHRRASTLALYGLLTVVGYTCAFLLRFGFNTPEAYVQVLYASLGVLVVLRVGSFATLRLDRTTWRFAGTTDVLRLGAATGAATLVFLLLSEAGLFGERVPRVIVLLEAFLTSNLTAAGWLYYRVSYEFGRTHGQTQRPRRALIVGSGEAAYFLAHEIQRSPLGYRLLGIIDDDPSNQHMDVCGTEVLGTMAELERIAAQGEADELLITPNWYDRVRFRQTIDVCQRTGLPMKVLPQYADMVRGDGLLSRLRAVKIEDLLGRAPVQLELPELARELKGGSVLITGGAGSIGSELARQVALHHPQTLVLFDHDETRLYYMELELRERNPAVMLVPIVGDITDPIAVERVFQRYHPDRVFHAAAYKHVPMMETNAREAVRNNVIGTRNVARISGEYGAQKFVLMSSDKAVRPCSVMGATKRLAELAVLELQQEYPATAFCGVRFGNVLGSNGSVLPIFERQLEAGHPLTVTHPDVTRYFMTIPEAVQLILQASLLPDIRGRIAMLEMGEPIRILDLAQKFLRLAGRAQTNGIIITGLRRGERLHEELIAPEEMTLETAIPKVRLVVTPRGATGEIARTLELWQDLLADGAEDEVLRQLQHQFPALTFRSPPTYARLVEAVPARMAVAGRSRSGGWKPDA